MTVKIERTPYKGWADACRIANERVELVATTLVGPRIIHFGFAGDGNEFKEIEATLGFTGGQEWHLYGGHRLWVAPESERTCYPDNAPVMVSALDANTVRLTQEPEAGSGIQKEIDLRLDPALAHVTVINRLRNVGSPEIELAPWALTVMVSGGVAVIPLPPRGPHPQNLLPTGRLALWAYTDMADERWTWGTKYILLRQDTNASSPLKIGAWVPDGWVAYARAGHLFIKTFHPQPGASYPDMGSSAEIFTDGEILEVETLGPWVRLRSGDVTEHVEEWFLFDGVVPPRSDADVDSNILPWVKENFTSGRIA